MDILIFIVIIVLSYYIYGKIFRKNSLKSYDIRTAIIENLSINEVIKDNKKDSYGKSQSIKYKSKIPKGYKIYLDIRDIILGYNIESAKKFINAKNQTLTLAREPDNKYDKNAIAVLSYEGKLGYIPSHIASSLVNNMDKELILRHQYIWVGEKRGSLHIQLLIKK